MPVEMDCPGITFNVQWKKKSGTVNRQADVTSIGLWDADDSTLDWQTFKSYLCQNLGTVDKISVAYIDSDGDELPIESECEFREALKFARQRARKGRETVLRVDRQESASSNSCTCKMSVKCLKCLSQDKVKSLLPPYTKPKNKIGPKFNHKSNGNGKNASYSNINEEKKSKEAKSSRSAESCESSNVEHAELMLKVLEKLKKMNLEQMDAPPPWFRRYMQKMKSDIVAEVTSNILHEIQQNLPIQREYSGTRGSNSWSLNKNKKKKKLSDEESSDGNLGCESRDHKLLKKIEKLHKREKKLEKKLDSKLEKLENKTKRMMEKRSQCKARCEKIPERKLCSVKRRSGDLHVGTYLMDAILLNDGPASEITIYPGQHFTKVWEIMNAGTLPWTDKTELRQAWGTSGLEPEDTVVKCPILQPDEQGTISMKFRAPEFPGKFKSYWHFYHMGDRFGHWIGCAVVVKDPKEDQVSVNETDDHRMFHADEPNDLSVDSSVKNKSDVINKLQLRKNECEQTLSGPINSGREEYESDFESDNLSVISGPGSESFDSDDDNFVVIPMPACFVCDVPLGQAETVSVVVKSDLKENKYTNNKLNDDDEDDEEGDNSEDDDVETTVPLPNEEEHEQFQSYEDRPLERVYAVDSSGCCFGVKYCNDTNIHTEIGEIQSSKSSTSGSDQSSGPAPAATSNIHQNMEGNSSASDSTKHPSSGSLGQDPLANVIHILPETLVAGAVNVASSAYSTARAVISNLRTRQQGDGAEWQWNLSSNTAQPTDSTTTENLERLLEMGFNNRILNVLLLQRYDNDITKVVAELVSVEE